MDQSEKIVGYDVRIQFHNGDVKDLHKKGSERAVDLWAMLKSGHRSHQILGTYTREQWKRVWGEGRM